MFPSYGTLFDYCWMVNADNNQDGFSDDQIITLLNKYGPLSGAIDANFTAMTCCKGDADFECGTELDHAIVIAGYTEDQWILKNCWGEDWGDDGYFYLDRGENKCGINSVVGVPFLY